MAREAFGVTPAGDPIDRFTLVNRQGMQLCLLELGAIVQSLRAPDRAGRLDDVVLGYDTLAPYVHESPYFGAVVGRCANRIAKGRFVLDGSEVQLTINDAPHHLHGGTSGFDKAPWKGTATTHNGAAGVSFVHVSPDGDQGYPGTLRADVTYVLTDRNEIVLDYVATSDRATPLNLTQHSYFNLAGAGRGDILDHRLTIFASHYTPIDDGLIPTGEIASVDGTPFDFRQPTRIGERVGDDHPQLRAPGGYDHNLVLDRGRDDDGRLMRAARLEDTASGRTLDVSTTEPSLQFYSGNFLDGTIRGKADRTYAHRSGLCLECQHFPDSPNQPQFPSTILRPGEEFRSRTVFTFGTSG